MTDREIFEKWITAPPIEANIERYPSDDHINWAGHYKDYSIQLAWEAWEKACNETRNIK